MQMTIDEIAVQQAVCLHPNPTIYYTGNVYFADGELTDTREEHLFCPDCGVRLDDLKHDENEEADTWATARMCARRGSSL